MTGKSKPYVIGRVVVQLEPSDELARLLEGESRACTNELQPDEDRRNFFKCSACGCTVTDAEDYCVNVYTSDGAVGWSYCPHCGAKVVE